MKTVRLYFFGFLIILFLSSCNNQSFIQAQELSKTTVSAQPTMMQDEISTYSIELPMDSVKELSQEEIAEKLFTSWLDHFKTSSVSDSYRLDDFKIENVEIPTDFQYCVKDLGVEYIALIRYSVQESIIPCPNWDAGNGDRGTNRWVKNKLLYIAVFKVGNNYSFQRKGVPPCDGIAVYSSPVPQKN
jgi:hypothetical protein